MRSLTTCFAIIEVTLFVGNYIRMRGEDPSLEAHYRDKRELPSIIRSSSKSSCDLCVSSFQSASGDARSESHY